MPQHSAGILLYRYHNGQLEVFLVHPGGPYWAKKDAGAWSIPKGLVDDSENSLESAQREFREETGTEVNGDFIALGSLVQPSKKVVTGFALGHDFDESQLISNLFELEWPPKSGKVAEFPEIDKGEWFQVETAKQKILKGQVDFITRLITILNYPENLAEH